MKKFLFDWFIISMICIVIKIIIQAIVYPNFLTINKSINWGYDWWNSGFYIVGFQLKYAIIASFLITSFKHTKI